MNATVTEALLVKYFTGEASALQKQLIDQWVREPDNQELFYAVLETWENQHPQYITDTKTARERHQHRLANHAEYGSAIAVAEKSGFFTHFGWIPTLLAAATIVLIVSWVKRDWLLYKTYTTSFGQISHLVLTDGSKVTLNANSTLKESRYDFGEKARVVRLTGEADFAVIHTADNRQFIVRTERGLDVVVLGTEFTVYSRQPGDRVILREGQVKLMYPQGATTRSVVMKPGDLVNVDRKGRVRSRAVRNPEQYASWRSNRFVFDQTTMPEVARFFSETYGLKLVIADPEVMNWTVTGSFTVQSADELLDILAKGSGMTYSQHDNIVTLTLPITN